MNDKTKNDLKKIAAFPLYWALGVFYGGYVLSQLWGWFVVPLGAPDVSYAQAAGLALMLAYVAKEPNLEKERPETWWGTLLFGATKITLFYFVAWLVSLLV